MMDTNALITGVVGLAAGIGGALAHAKRLENKLAPVVHGAVELIEGFKAKHESKVALSDAQDALKAETTAERDALFKAAGYSFLQALQVSVLDLNDIQKATLAQYISDFVPKYKAEITPARIDAILKLIQQEQEAAKAHSGLQAVQAIMEWMDSTKDNDDAQVTNDLSKELGNPIPTQTKRVSA